MSQMNQTLIEFTQYDVLAADDLGNVRIILSFDNKELLALELDGSIFPVFALTFNAYRKAVNGKDY